MTILLQWLVDNVWILYVACVIGAAVYLVQALAGQRELRLAMFSLERDRARTRIAQSWVMVLVFAIIGALIFILTVRVVPDLELRVLAEPTTTPTMAAGFSARTVAAQGSPTPEIPMATLASGSLTATVESTPEGTETLVPVVVPSETPAAAPTDTVESPEIGVSGEVGVQMGEFARLVGFSLPSSEVTTAKPLQLTLYWEALQTPEQGYQVFTHLMSSDGRLIAQHDGAPAGGTLPTNGWVGGQSVIDVHSMVFLDQDFTGEAQLVVGMYDPATGRLPTESGDDSVVLPVTIVVVSP